MLKKKCKSEENKIIVIAEIRPTRKAVLYVLEIKALSAVSSKITENFAPQSKWDLNKNKILFYIRNEAKLTLENVKITEMRQ